METIDLRGDNRVYELLEIIETQNSILADARSLRDAAKEELVAKIGSATSALINDWAVEWKKRARKEVIIPAGESSYLVIRRRKTNGAATST